MSKRAIHFFSEINSWLTGRQSVIFLINTAFFVIGVIMLIGPAIQNGFPIVHADSGTYLLEGFGTKIPVSRPLSYCLFVRFTSRIFSIWTVVITQAIFVYWVTWLAVNTLAGKRKLAWLPFLTIAMLVATTGVSFYASQIMPDIFLPIAILGVFVILARTKLPWFTLIFLGITIWISLIVHMSNLPVVTGLMLAVLFLQVIIHKSLRTLVRTNVYIIAAVIALSWVTNPLISVKYGEGFRVSNSSSIVFFSRLLQAGAAQQYIKDRCDKEPGYYLCEYRDKIDSYNRLDIFLWTDSSFLYDHPCRQKTWDQCWRERNEEFGKVNSEILAYKPSRKVYLQAVRSDFLLALHAFGLTGYVSFKEGSHIDYPLKNYYKNDYKSYKNSRQYSGTIVFSDMNRIIKVTVYVALALLVLLLIRNRKFLSFNSPYFILLSMLFLTWLGNAMLTALLAVVSERFLGRFIWLVPFLVIMMVYHEFSDSGISAENDVSDKNEI